MKEYKKILTGKIQYDAPTKDLEIFRGTLKLKKDPISEELTINNLALKGSTLTHSDWMIGLVLYTGFEVKAFNKDKEIKNYFQNDCFFDQFLNRLNIMTIAVIMINLLICLVRVFPNDYFQKIFQENLVEVLFVNFVCIIPINVLTLVHLLLLLYKYILENKFAGSLKILDPNKFSYMNQITHLILDRNTTINPAKTAVHSIHFSKTKNFFLTPKFSKKKQDLLLNKNKKNNHQSPKKSKVELTPAQMKKIDLFKKDQVKDKPRIILESSDSSQMIVSEEGNVSLKPNENNYKFSSNLIKNHSSSSKIDIGIEKSKDVEVILTIENEIIGKEDQLIKSEEKLNIPFKESQLPLKSIISSNDSQDIDRLGILKDIIGDNIFVPNKYNEIFNALLLCHEVQSKEIENNSKRNYFNEFSLPDTQPILEFARSYHYKFLYQCSIFNDLIKCYTVQINEKISQFYVLGTNFNFLDSSECKYKFSILLKSAVSLEMNHENSDEDEDSTILYIRSNDISSLDRIDIEESEREILKLKMEELTVNGIKFVLFFQKKNMSGEEVNKYNNYMKNSHHSPELLSEILKLESNCEFLSIIALKDKSFPGLKPLINDFFEIENKVWLLSNDTEDQVISTGYLLEILNKECETVRLDIPSNSCTLNEAWIKIRFALNKIRKIIFYESNESGYLLKSKFPIDKNTSIEKKNLWNSYSGNYNLILNGKTLNILIQDDDLFSHFAFLAHFSRGLIGYEMNPKEKEILVRMIKEKFHNFPVTMVVGDGYDDIQMMRMADISIEMRQSSSTKKIITSTVGGDFSMDSFKLLRDLIRVKSITFNSKIIKIIMISYGLSFLYIMPQAFYIMFFGIMACPMIAPFLFLIKDCIVLNLLGVLIFFWGERYSIDVLKTFVFIYKDGKKMTDEIYKLAFFKVLLQNTLDSLLLIIFIVFSSDYIIMGNNFIYEEFWVILYSTVFLMSFLRMIYFFDSPFIMAPLIIIFAIAIYYITAFIVQAVNNYDFNINMLQSILYISEKGEILLLLIFLLFFQLLKSFFMKLYFYQKMFQSNYMKVINSLDEGNLVDSIKNLHSKNKKPTKESIYKNVSDAIRHIFKYRSTDNLIQDSKFYKILSFICFNKIII